MSTKSAILKRRAPNMCIVLAIVVVVVALKPEQKYRS
jgi:hypothetical protein